MNCNTTHYRANSSSVPGDPTRKNFSILNEQTGHAALGLAIRKLGVAGTFMQAPAHPDDETNALFAMFAHGWGLRAIDVQNNRGDGGQNEIGPELFRDIGVLRTSELVAAHRIDGAEQYFTRAIDYGYSFDPQEVIKKWGHDEIVGDYVRLLRTLRPDVVVTMNIQGGGGDRAHEATTLLVRDSFRAAGDPTKYPEQLKEGLRPWQPAKLYFAGAGGGRGGRGAGGATTPAPAHVTRIDTSTYDALLGRTYAEIGSDAHSNHKCQGTGGVGPLPGGAGGGRGGGRPGGPPAGGGAGAGGLAGAGAPGGPPAGGAGGQGPAGGGGATYTLMDTTITGQQDKDETSFFDGIDYSLAGLARFAGGSAPAPLTAALSTIAEHAQRARQAFDAGNDAGTVAPIEAGLVAVRNLRAQIASMNISDTAKYEIDFRLKYKEQDYQNAVMAAHGLTFDAVANDGLVIGGQPVQLTLVGVNRGTSDITVSEVSIAGLEGTTSCAAATLKKDGVFNCSATGNVPKTVAPTEPYFDDDYWKHPDNPAIYKFDPKVPFGVPFAPTPYRATFKIKAGAVEVTKELPIQFRYVKDIYFGDKRMDLTVVPAFSVRVTPALAVIPSQIGSPTAKAVTREVIVSVTNGTKGAASALVALEVPAGWTTTKPSPVAFEKEDESMSARFVVTAPLTAKIGDYAIKAVVTSSASGDEKFSSGYQEIEYPHIQRAQVLKAAETTVKVIDVKTTANVKVGYIVGVGDQVPPALEQLGAQVTFIETNELAWGDLSKYNIIMTGVRAYERRMDLRAYNKRLIDYATKGGVVIVQYNKTEFNQAQYGPFPAQVGNGRVSDESVPVKVLIPSHPVFNTPNKIGPATWEHWTQERGLYFLGNKDAKYTDLVSMTDSFPDNPGEKLGSFVEGKVGTGRWIYLGLGLWRQLPAGTPGAYQLMANLISLKGTVAPVR